MDQPTLTASSTGIPSATIPSRAHAAAPTAHAARLGALPAGALDFDFLHGRWQVRGRRLAERLVGCTEWLELEATCECWPMLDGLANADELRTEFLPGFVGMTVRVFDPKAAQWAIYWADNRVGILDPPMRGSFDGDVGTFFGPDVHAGRAVLSRFTWTRATTPRWEQAFSADGGRTWETNWVMDFTRVA